MILHIGPISQFTKFSLESFESSFPGKNIFLVTNKKNLSNKESNYPNGCELLDISAKISILKYFKLIRNADAIIVHGMTIQGAISFIFGKKGLRIWSGWGYDYYGKPRDPDANVLSDATIDLIQSKELSKGGISSIIMLFKLWAFACLQEIAAKRADYFSAPIPQDYFVFKKRFRKTLAKYIQINYGDVMSTFYQSPGLISGNDILVGNSSSATNNHIDIFNIIRYLDIKDRKIIVPLTYGDMLYRDQLIEIGQDYFGDNFVPIINHLPLKEYIQLISNCNVVIMNHYRQQGAGNIGACLYSGKHVYLNKKNPLFDFFCEKKAIFRSIDDLTHSKLPKGLLSPLEISKNRAILEEFWGEEVVRNNTINLISKIQER